MNCPECDKEMEHVEDYLYRYKIYRCECGYEKIIELSDLEATGWWYLAYPFMWGNQ